MRKSVYSGRLHFMPALTSEEFLDYLKRSELLEPSAFKSALADIAKEARDSFNDPSKLASEFIKRKLLTSWHVRQLMKRKYKGFYLRQYRILGHLGSGGMSSVYLAEHTVMKRRVAIKVLPKRRLNPVYLDRFAREAQAIAALDSPHVVRAYDVDRFEDVHYIVMEYFEGQNLRQLVDKEGPLPYEDSANYIRQAALGLADAHRIGIIHRDVKPENIVVDERDFVKVLDLGLALLDERAFSIKDSIADEDKILGTADYLAPEQALDSHRVDARADIYGLGATLYFCLTGRPPFPFGTISERLLAHQRKEPVSIFNERPDAPVDLVEICAKMMAKKPENRIQTTEQVAEIMKMWLIHNGFAQPADFAQDKNSTVGIDELENLVSHSDAERQFLANNPRATEIGFDRETKGFMLSDVELASVVQKTNENSVDLYDATESGSVSKLSRSRLSEKNSKTPIVDDLVLSKKSDLDAALDPLELVLDEISDTTKTRPNSNGNNAFDCGSNGVSSTTSEQVTVGISRRQANNFQDAIATDHSEVVTKRSKQGSTSFNSLNARTCDANLAPVKEGKLPSNVARERTCNESEGERGTATPSCIQDPFKDWYKNVPIWFWTVAVGGYAVAIFLAGVLLALLFSIKQ